MAESSGPMGHGGTMGAANDPDARPLCDAE